MASPTKLRTGFQFLTKTSWDSGRLTSTKRVAARDHSPEETHSTLEMGAPIATQETEWLELGGDKTHSPPGETVLAKHLVT